MANLKIQTCFSCCCMQLVNLKQQNKLISNAELSKNLCLFKEMTPSIVKYVQGENLCL